MKRPHLVRDIVEVVAIAILVFVAIRFTIQSYTMAGSTMNKTLNSGENIIVNKSAYIFHAPQRGDIIVFHYPLDVSKDKIKRIIGLPGDTIQTDSTNVIVDGTLLKEPYVQHPYNPAGETFKVPAGQYFVMDDNRLVTDDLRTWGDVPRDYIVGKAALVFWPFSTFRFIKTDTTVYAHIKGSGN